MEWLVTGCCCKSQSEMTQQLPSGCPWAKEWSCSVVDSRLLWLHRTDPKVCNCKTGKPHTEGSQLSIQKSGENEYKVRCIYPYRCSCLRSHILQAYHPTSAAPPLHPSIALCTAFVIHSRQGGFWFTFTWELRSTRLGWCACGEICLGLQAAFSPAKVLGRAPPPEKWCNAVRCRKKHTRDSPSQTPDKLLDSVSIGVRIRIYVLQLPAESPCSRQS